MTTHSFEKWLRDNQEKITAAEKCPKSPYGHRYDPVNHKIGTPQKCIHCGRPNTI